jgi:hypothetical protein
VFPKTPSAVGTISSALNRKNILFASLSTEDIERVIERMEPLTVPAGVTLIQQGDEATEFFVVQSGVMDVFVDGAKVSTASCVWSHRRRRTRHTAHAAVVCPRHLTPVSTFAWGKATLGGPTASCPLPPDATLC